MAVDFCSKIISEIQHQMLSLITFIKKAWKNNAQPKKTSLNIYVFVFVANDTWQPYQVVVKLSSIV